MTNRPGYRSPDYDFFSPDFQLDMVVSQQFAGEGFGAEFRTFETKPQAAYFVSKRNSMAGHFWIRISEVQLVPVVSGSIRVEIGEVDLVGFPPHLLLRDKGEKARFDFVGHSCLDVENLRRQDNGEWTSEFFPQFENVRSRPAEYRAQIARGLFWLGAPLDLVLEETQAELSSHERIEWPLQRREFCWSFWQGYEPRRQFLRRQTVSRF